MNRRLSMVLAAYGVWSQATVLFFLDPMKRQVSDLVEPEATVGEVQLLGLSLEGFAVRDLHQVQGWLPQVVFLLLSGLLTYGVLRASGAMRPRLGTVLALGGAALLAAGVATLTGPALDPDAVTVMPPYDDWVLRARTGEVPGAAAQFALLTLWLPVVLWLLVWRYRDWQPLRTYLRTAEGAESDGSNEDNGSREGRAKPGPSPVSSRARRRLLSAGLIPAVLLAVAGGPVLRHTRVRHLSQGAPGLRTPRSPSIRICGRTTGRRPRSRSGAVSSTPRCACARSGPSCSAAGSRPWWSAPSSSWCWPWRSGPWRGVRRRYGGGARRPSPTWP
ncbi:hypothetical protein ACFV2E_35340 [Streptomyces globisporus]|uniref:hypothetical protein n=1 Tax=Streptomyces globisporus TaxID=1908 RepID=UPI0036CDE0C9